MTRKLTTAFALLAATILFGAPGRDTLAQKGGKGGGGTTLNYQIVYLDDLDGFLTTTAAYDVNRYWEIVGSAEVTDPDTGTHGYAAYWSAVDGPNGVQTTAYQLSSTGYGDVAASGINDYSEIVGRGYAETGYVGLYWPTPEDDPLVLPPLQGDSQTDAQKINADGVICGHSWSHTTVVTAVVWQAYLAEGSTPAVTNPVALPVPDGTTSASVYAINDLDGNDICQLVGSVRTPQGEVPVRWTVASTEFGLLVTPSAESLAPEGRALGINNRGDVSGMGPTTTDEWLPTVWSGENTYNLKRARNIGFTFLRDINDAGVVVGEGALVKRGLFYSYLAAVWTSPQSEMILLNSFLSNNSPYVELNGASAVNPAGDIVGYGWTGEKQNAYLAIRR